MAAFGADFAVAIVTDGATGHGLDIVRRLTRHGHVVALTYLHDQAAVETDLGRAQAVDGGAIEDANACGKRVDDEQRNAAGVCGRTVRARRDAAWRRRPHR